MVPIWAPFPRSKYATAKEMGLPGAYVVLSTFNRDFLGHGSSQDRKHGQIGRMDMFMIIRYRMLFEVQAWVFQRDHIACYLHYCCG